MDRNSEKLNLLLIRLENLMLRQQSFESEINALKAEVKSLQNGEGLPVQQQSEPAIREPVKAQPTFIPPQAFPSERQPVFEPGQAPYRAFEKFNRTNMVRSDLEKFIGENLISKIGIFILILGVCIGAKYAIDHDMVSPLTRIVLGYMVGAGLMAFALKLKAKYENFSAVLLSGSIAILYFITYAAYGFYLLIPQELTFGLMVLFTSFAVLAAVKYDKQVIAHIGLVGAYAIPFLLSDGSGKVAVLFTYIAVINAGILVLSFKKYWKPLFYAAFLFTWLIFLSWYLTNSLPDHFILAITFATVSFLTFYITNLAYKVIRKEQLDLVDTAFVLLNSFIYYGIGYGLVSSIKDGDQFLGLYTLINAVIHFVICLIVYKRKLTDKNLFYLVLAVVIIFITIAFPVQLNGDWVTLFWVVEATILFYLGRVKGIAVYEKIAFPLIFLSFLSLMQDWGRYDPGYDYRTSEVLVRPFINIGFLSGLLFIGAFYLMNKINNQVDEQNELKWLWKTNTLNFAIPGILLVAVYMTFRIELTNCFDLLYYSSRIIINTNQVGFAYKDYIYNADITDLEVVSICIYSMLFATALNWLSVKKVKTKALTITALVISLISLLAFLGIGQYCLAKLRESFIAQDNRYFTSGAINIGIRYIGLGFIALLLISMYQLCKTTLSERNLKQFFSYILYLSLLWLLSSELITILDLLQSRDTYKLSLSIFWGIYALFLVVMGLWKNKKHLRIGAMVLFGITLIKLFLYDIAYLGTISKTIVFISLGILLLVISFLYNKYKHLIIDDIKT